MTERARDDAREISSTRRLNSARRVLVVDDNEDLAMMLGKALECGGHDVVTAYDGPTALTSAAAFRPEAALVDLGLPVMDGFELAGKLRALPGLGRIKLVAVTGYCSPRDVERSEQAGFDEHLVKPIAPSRLERLIADLFDEE
jgi:two-component system CheB/CheR fusion protein